MDILALAALAKARQGGGMSDDAKEALFDLLEKVVYVDANGAQYLQNLEDALYSRTLSSITAVFTQGQTVVYPYTELDALKANLVVTAHYSDNTDVVLEDNAYTLSGTLTTGTSTIAVAYEGKTASFSVSVSADNTRIHIYHFNDSLTSDGNVDFGLSATTPSYTTGKIGKAMTVAASTPANVPSSIGFSNDVKPVLDGDFTIAFWGKSSSGNSNTMFRLSEYREDQSVPSSGTYTAYNGHTHKDDASANNRYTGVTCSFLKDGSSLYPFYTIFVSENKVYCFLPTYVAANSLTANVWHHFAVCRKDGIATLYIDGLKWWSVPIPEAVYVPNQILFGGSWDSTNTAAGITVPANVNPCVDEFYINDKQALYTDEFTPPTEPYSL